MKYQFNLWESIAAVVCHKFVFSALKPAFFGCFDRVCHTFNGLNGLILEGLLDLQLFPLNSEGLFARNIIYNPADFL